MTTTSQIPADVRKTFQRIPVIDEHRQLFNEPTSPLLKFDTDTCIEVVRHVGDASTRAVNLHPAWRFMMEAQFEALEDLLIGISERHPERFRETERGLDLLKNLEILLNGTKPGDCGPAGA